MEELEQFEKKWNLTLRWSKVSLNSNSAHDETFSYNLAVNYYNKSAKLRLMIKELNQILKNKLIKNDDSEWKNNIYFLFCSIGYIYYLLKDYSFSAGYFMKSLIYEKQDITCWVGLLFSLRAMGNFKLFETAIFNFPKIYSIWDNETKQEFNQKYFLELIEKIR